MRRQKLTKSITAHVTEDDYAVVMNAIGDDTRSDWVRDVVMAAARSQPATHLEMLMAELLALRRILLNLHAWPLTTEPFTADALERLITESDELKMAQARARLEAGDPQQ